MFKTLANAWAIPELRKKLIFTALILLVFCVGGAVPVPYVDTKMLSDGVLDTVMSGTILGLYNMMSGSALSQATVLALGIQPYINSSIIVQLLTIAIPVLERWSKEEGEEGKKKLNILTRIVTIALGLLMGWAYYMMLSSYNGLITETGFIPGLVIVLVFAAGSCFVMWLGEQITEHGIGNGISMILFANIIAGLPNLFAQMFSFAWWLSLIMVIGFAALVILIVFVNDAERRIPVQYAKRVVGRKIYGGQSTDLPIKVSMTGVMPVIFAQSIASLPATIYAFAGWSLDTWMYKNVWSSTSWLYAIGYALLIFFFSWFYSTIQYDPVEISNNLKKNGGFIPGFRPGKPTAEFIKKVINKIVVFGAVYLSVVALLPIIAGNLTESSLAIGGTSIIILVSVALETVKALEAQMLMRHYKGFLD